MRIWNVKVLNYGKITLPMSALWTALLPPLQDFSMVVPYPGFLLQSEGENILIDTGISEKFIIDGKAWGSYPAEGGKAYVEKALAKEGLKPADIKTVIYTHLHNDHAGNCELFKDATIIFQKAEWANLLDPLPIQNTRRDYDPSIIAELRSLRILKVDGDFDLREGITIYKTPGHTQGSQSIAVNTKRGTAIFVGDIANFYKNIFPHTTEITSLDGSKHSLPDVPDIYGEALPSSLTYNFYDFYDSVRKIKAIASRDEPGFIVPGHEPSLVLAGSI